ncbi:MAG: hypothetical protein NTU95_05620 [Methanothrix sp.]|nr:hypothetical protein [Methanothrix sp.]
MGVCVCDWPKGENLGKYSELIRLISAYKKEIPIEFLAYASGESPSRTLERLKGLEKEGLIIIKGNKAVVTALR